MKRYFPDLSPEQERQIEAIQPLYMEWNEKINVVSRRDINNIFTRHILHSLTIAKMMTPVEGSTIVDVGTGGGFPGIPLAIMWPQCRLHLVDRIAKKIKVASEIASAIGLTNVTFQHGDMGECHAKFDFAVSRAVMQLDALVKIVRRNISSECRNSYRNGLICLKGGDLSEEIRKVPYPVVTYPVREFFPDIDFFDTKELVYVPMI